MQEKGQPNGERAREQLHALGGGQGQEPSTMPWPGGSVSTWSTLLLSSNSVSRDENIWALSAVWVDPSIKLQASQHSSQSKNSNMVGAGQASGVPCNVHLALEVAFPHLTQKGISHDTESSGSHELDGVCKGNKQTQNTGIGQNNLLSRYGKELRVVAEEVLGGKKEGLLWGRGSGLCAKQRRLVAKEESLGLS